MLIWIERANAQEKSTAKEGTSVTRVSTDHLVVSTLHMSETVQDHVKSTEVLRLNDKALSTLAAQYALVGRELRTIVKEGRTYFEVSRWNECFTVSSMADLQGLLRQFEATS